MLEKLKMLLGLDQEDAELDEKLNWIISSTQKRLKLLLGGIEPPDEMDYIVIDVSIIRFNRIGSEGMKSQGVEGESISFSDDDFSGFREEIQAFLDSQKDATKGRLRFL
ncbi:phage head-tail connector protein [Dorea sp. D27]|uniref:phage head-tail connector protein n=1 Tax=Dorea sp. D27 TaxID=658665 RepID=UPI0006737056|nr:phage head-tail connector protein [Dorea sp. D27]KMZ52341.1 prophage protein [Dorea sp. D27]